MPGKELDCLVPVAQHEGDLAAVHQAQLYQLLPETNRVFLQLPVS
jgi:hypothetical protein